MRCPHPIGILLAGGILGVRWLDLDAMKLDTRNLRKRHRNFDSRKRLPLRAVVRGSLLQATFYNTYKFK